MVCELGSRSRGRGVCSQLCGSSRCHDTRRCHYRPGDSADFVSRFFIPQLGINEDPVTGSAHASSPSLGGEVGQK